MSLKRISSSSSVRLFIVVFACFVFNVNVSCQSTSYSRSNTSNLCSRSPAAVQSCAHQLSLLNPDSCLVKLTHNSSSSAIDANQCNWSYTYQLDPCQENDCVQVDLQVYRHALPRIPLYRTALNLTLSNIQQQSQDSSTVVRVRYRYMFSDDFSFCLNFTLQLQQDVLLLPSHQSLWFDCVFFKRFYEGKPFIMDVVQGDKYAMFSFQIPTETEIDGGFVYIHLHHLPHQLIATFQLSQNDESTNYAIVICRWNEQGQCQTVEPPLQVDLQNSSSYLYRRKDLVTVQVIDKDFIIADGNYSITVTSVDKDAISYRVTSPFFIVNNSKQKMTTTLIVCIFIVLLTVLVFFGCVVAYWKNCDNEKKINNKKKENKAKVLLVYDPIKTDPIWLQALSVFVEKLAGYQVWLDSIEIPKSVHKDPLVWYSTGVDQADIVAVVVSPHSPTTPSSTSIYTGTYELALELIASQIASRCKSTASTAVLKRYVVIESSATAAQVPSMCTSFKRFRFPIEAFDFIHYVDTSNGSEKRSRSRLFIDYLFNQYHRLLTKDTRLFLTQSFDLIYNQLLKQQQQQQSVDFVSSITTTEQCHLLMDDDDDHNVEAMNRRRHQLDLDFGGTIAAVTSLPSVTDKSLQQQQTS